MPAADVFGGGQTAGNARALAEKRVGINTFMWMGKEVSQRR